MNKFTEMKERALGIIHSLKITDYLETEAFTQGFTIAVKLMVEVMKTMEIPEV